MRLVFDMWSLHFTAIYKIQGHYYSKAKRSKATHTVYQTHITQQQRASARNKCESHECREPIDRSTEREMKQTNFDYHR